MNRKLLLKQVIITSVLTLMFFNLSAQSEKKFNFKGQEYFVKPEVIAFLGKEKVDEYSTKGTLKLMYYNFYSKNSFEILNELPAKKGVEASTISYLPNTKISNDPNDFQILNTNIQPSEKSQFFKLNDKFIMVYPQSAIDRNFDVFIKSLSNN